MELKILEMRRHRKETGSLGQQYYWPRKIRLNYIFYGRNVNTAVHMYLKLSFSFTTWFMKWIKQYISSEGFYISIQFVLGGGVGGTLILWTRNNFFNAISSLSFAAFMIGFRKWFDKH